VIVATAGHVDHGKTTLVRALNGFDSDTLPEEKRRGMTIDLNFSYLPVDGGESVAFIDVPGHQRFIRNLLCGVGGIDFVLLVVAADDGPMPQTREHLAIFDLLETRDGAVIITKIDRVDYDQVSICRELVIDLMAGTAFKDFPIFPVSSVSGAGIMDLRKFIISRSLSLPTKDCSGNFRMPIDRSFTKKGTGLVVTGTVSSGSISLGEHINVFMAGRTARVRSIHAHNAPSGIARIGQRCALNLAGLKIGHDDISRGDWAISGNCPAPMRRIDVRLRISKYEASPLAHWTPVHVYLGASNVAARVAVLNDSNIPPGESRLAQLVLDRPIGALRGDRAIIRDQSTRRTLGGGKVIDVFPPARGRAKPSRLAYLAAMEIDDIELALSSLIQSAPNGVSISRFSLNRNLTSAETTTLFGRSSVKTVSVGEDLFAFSLVRWNEIKSRLLQALEEWHRHKPDSLGPTIDKISSMADLLLSGETLKAVVTEMAREGSVERHASTLKLSSHQPRLKASDAGLWRKIEPLIQRKPARPPGVHEIAETIGEEPQRVEAVLARAARAGLIFRISKHRFCSKTALRRLALVVEEVAGETKGKTMTVAAFRDRSGIGRNLTIEVLECFDRMRFTRRIGNERMVLHHSGDIFGKE